jgi:predicted cobalt transporter CbtA
MMPGSNNTKKALVLAGIIWFVLYLVVAVKYPANPPAVGDPETIYYRQALYVAMLAISGLAALGAGVVYHRMKAGARKFIAPGIYAAAVIAAFLALPPNPEAISAPMDLVISFRVASAATMTAFWIIMVLILGAFWDRLKPHETTRIKTV